MPDSERALNLVIDSTFNPKGVKAAQAGIGQTERSFRDMTRTITGAKIAEHIEGALAPMQKMKGVNIGLASAMNVFAKDIVGTTKALGAISDELRTVESASQAIKLQYSSGVISGKQYKEAMGTLRAMRQDLRGMSADEYQAMAARNQSMQDLFASSQRAQTEMKKYHLTTENMTTILADYDKGVVQIARDLNMSYAQASKFAEDFTNHLAYQKVEMDETARAAEQMASGMGFLGSLKRGFKNIGEDLIGAGKGFAGVLMQAPRRLSEGVKDGLSNAFSSRPITRALAEIPKRMFSMSTLKKTALFGPLGFISGMLTKSKPKQEFARAGEKEGPMGGIIKSLGSFGGIMKSALGAFGPAMLLLKALEPAIQTLTWAIEPLLAPLQQLMSDAVMQLVPFISELSKEFVVLAEELLPPITQLIKQLMPIFMDIIRAVLPPLTTLLKMTMEWIGKLAGVLGKVLVPILGWVGEQIVWVADKIGGIIDWLIGKLGWVLDWLGIDVGTSGKKPNTASATSGTEGGAQAIQASQPRMIPGVNVQGEGVAGEVRPMTVQEAGATEQYMQFTRPRGSDKPLMYRDGELQSGRRDLTSEALREVFNTQPDVVSREEPEKASEPIVRAIDKMTNRLLTILPKKIGEETKSITLANFGAVTA